MNVFDIIFALLLGLAIYMGITKGFIIQITAVLALLLGIYLSFKFSHLMARWITDFGVGTKAIAIISFTLTFIAVVIAARLLGSLMDRIVSIAMLGWLNKLLGIIFAVIKMALIVSVALFIINSIDKELNFMPRQQVQNSKFYKPLSNLAPSVLGYLDFDKIKKSAKEVDRKIDAKIEGLD